MPRALPTPIRRCLYASLLPLLGGLSLALPAPQPCPTFHAAFVTTFTSVLNFPLVEISVTGTGHARHMGQTTATTTNQLVNVLTGEATATYDLRAANGDVLTVELDAIATLSQTGATYLGTYTVTGGTGRFSCATGSGTICGAATNTGPSSGVGTFTLHGTLTR